MFEKFVDVVDGKIMLERRSVILFIYTTSPSKL